MQLDANHYYKLDNATTLSIYPAGEFENRQTGEMIPYPEGIKISRGRVGVKLSGKAVLKLCELMKDGVGDRVLMDFVQDQYQKERAAY